MTGIELALLCAIAPVVGLAGFLAGGRAKERELASELRLIRIEWTRTQSEMDRLVKRLVRYGKVPVGADDHGAATNSETSRSELRRQLLLGFRTGPFKPEREAS